MKFQQDYPKWKSWNLTTLTQKWLDGTAANYGVIPKYRDNFLWATNEDTDGYDLRLLSSEDYDPNLNDWPYLEIIWSENLRTVYFLKDHLGSIRATVDAESDTVVGYDDYDAWGLILAGRSLATPWSSVQGTARTSLPREIKAVKFPDRVRMLAIIGLHRQAPSIVKTLDICIYCQDAFGKFGDNTRLKIRENSILLFPAVLCILFSVQLISK